jgi:HD-GYP domain-containing protein (c-di-GMP phosphodiesterase class II)
MEALKLKYPVYTVENQLLLPADTVLSPETVEDLISSGKERSYQTYPLLSYGTVRNDILRLISKPPYDLIFPTKGKIADIVTIMEKVHLVLPVLQSLDYFKEYDYHTYCHVLMVFALSTLIARDLIPDYQECVNEVSTGPTHDIGKICIPLKILKKQTPLTKSERNYLYHHTIAGYVLLSYFNKDRKHLAAVVARDHHELKDGSGKPRGIKLTNRMVEIIVACDIYDALISPRPYRPMSYDNRTALEEITVMAEMNRIGWEVVKALVAHNRKAKPGYRETNLSSERRGTPPPHNLYGVVADEHDE